jgi:hypothetical protein
LWKEVLVMKLYVLISQFMHEGAVVSGIYTSVPAVQEAEQELRDRYAEDGDYPCIDWEEKEVDVMPVSGKKWME